MAFTIALRKNALVAYYPSTANQAILSTINKMNSLQGAKILLQFTAFNALENCKNRVMIRICSHQFSK